MSKPELEKLKQKILEISGLSKSELQYALLNVADILHQELMND